MSWLSEFPFIPTPSSKGKSMRSTFSSPQPPAEKKISQHAVNPHPSTVNSRGPRNVRTPYFSTWSRPWRLLFSSTDDHFWASISASLRIQSCQSTLKRRSCLWLHILVPYCLPSLASLLRYPVDINIKATIFLWTKFKVLPLPAWKANMT